MSSDGRMNGGRGGGSHVSGSGGACSSLGECSGGLDEVSGCTSMGAIEVLSWTISPSDAEL